MFWLSLLLEEKNLEEVFGRKYLTYWETGKKWDFFVEAGEKLFVSRMNEEFLEEMKGIAARLPYQPAGAVDGKVMDSDLAKKLSFWARWGSSSGMPFDAQAFLSKHTRFSYLEGYLKDRPPQPWTLFKAGE